MIDMARRSHYHSVDLYRVELPGVSHAQRAYAKR